MIAGLRPIRNRRDARDHVRRRRWRRFGVQVVYFQKEEGPARPSASLPVYRGGGRRSHDMSRTGRLIVRSGSTMRWVSVFFLRAATSKPMRLIVERALGRACRMCVGSTRQARRGLYVAVFLLWAVGAERPAKEIRPKLKRRGGPCRWPTRPVKSRLAEIGKDRMARASSQNRPGGARAYHKAGIDKWWPHPRLGDLKAQAVVGGD